MSQDYHHQAAAASAGIFGFPNGFERSQQEEHQQQIIAQQIRRDKMRQGFEPPPPLVAMDEDQESSGVPIHGYDQTGGMLSEMFNYPPGAVTATELLQQQISSGNYQIRPSQSEIGGSHDHNWYVGHDHNKGNHSLHHQQQQIGGSTNINPSDSAAAAMHLFLLNPSAARSPSPSPPSSSTLHMLLPNPSPNSTSNSIHQTFHSPTAFGPSHQQFTWAPPGNTSHDAGSTTTTTQFTGHHHIIEGHGQGLSLTLSSSLQHLEAAKAEEFRSDDGSGGMLFFNQGVGGGSNSNANASLGSQYSFKNLGGNQQALHLQGNEVVMGNQNQQVHVAFGSSSLGVVNVLRTSKYVKAAQELLEEFCSVGRGQFKKTKLVKPQNSSANPNSNPAISGSGGGAGASSSSSKDLPPLSAADRIEHQRRKVKLLSMLDEVDRRYNHYCEQMQMVVNSFDIVMGYGAAVPYTALAQKAMSRHFRCLKDAIAAEIKQSCELLGEKDAAGTSGVTKGETPRLKLLEQSLRQQRAFHQMGMMEQEAWRPQRGLPERSVNILRAWLFEHFLHPYPTDADKHLLARQTGLSRNQVSNWFINARVRLWKPMVEDMYQQESKEEGEDADDTISNPNAPTPAKSSPIATTPTSTSTPSTVIRSEFNAPENDPSILAINNTQFPENQAPTNFYTPTAAYRRGEHDYTTADDNIAGSTIISFGSSSTTTGDVSLTLGLRHVGNMPEKSPFSVRDFGGC